MQELKQKILTYLSQDGRMTAEQLSKMLGCEEKTVRDIINGACRNGELLSFGAMVNWEKAGKESVTALVELKTVPVRDRGFDAVAERICKYPEVQSVYLMSGSFDLAVTVECRTMRDVAMFVAERLATIDGVTSTATHFLMQKYKDAGIMFDRPVSDKRGME